MGNTSVPFNIFNSTGLLGFVQGARQGYADYRFVHHFYFYAADGDAIVYRWQLNATLREMVGSTKPPGTHIAYNGTDILIRDHCSGLVNEVFSARDFISHYHELGYTSIAV